MLAHINKTIFSYLGVSRRQVRWGTVYLQSEMKQISGERERDLESIKHNTLTSGPVGAERGWVGWSISVGWFGLPPAGSWSYCSFNNTQTTLIQVAQSRTGMSSFTGEHVHLKQISWFFIGSSSGFRAVLFPGALGSTAVLQAAAQEEKGEGTSTIEDV